MQTKHQVVANPGVSQSTWTMSLLEEAAITRIHYHHLLLLSPNADTHFIIPPKVEG